jgi:glutathione S-transferase
MAEDTSGIETLKRAGLVVSIVVTVALLATLIWLLATRAPDHALIVPWRYTALATLGVVIVLQYVSLKVGRARHTYQVPLPEVSGPEAFNRVFRVHMNTLENVPLFLPLLWLFAAAWGDSWAGIFGGAWVAGRFLYAWGYYRAVSLRLCGFGISSSAALLMLVACLYAVLAAL